MKKKVLVRQYGKGPWHLVRDDKFTVCGKGPNSAPTKTATQQAANRTAEGVRGTALPIDKVCANCERMADADTIRLATP